MRGYSHLRRSRQTQLTEAQCLATLRRVLVDGRLRVANDLRHLAAGPLAAVSDLVIREAQQFEIDAGIASETLKLEEWTRNRKAGDTETMPPA
jgi:hypothetical protein